MLSREADALFWMGRYLERAGYSVLYREFDGPHVAPPNIGREAAGWFTGETPSR